jgi:hypothetical protein
MDRINAGIPTVLHWDLYRPSHRRWLLPSSDCCRHRYVCPWDLHGISINEVLATLPGTRPVLWSRERISFLSVREFVEHILYDEEKFRHSYSSRWQRYWRYGVPSYGRTASSTDRIPLDYESLGVCPTRMFSIVLHWVETARSSEENWGFGGLGKFQGAFISFVRGRDVLRKFLLRSKLHTLMRAIDILGSLFCLLLHWILRTEYYPCPIHPIH